MKSRFLNGLAIVVILEIGVLHLMTAQGEYEEAAYMGYLFVANFMGALLAAYGIYRRQLWGWYLGLFVALGSIAGYIWSRTLGMPGMEMEEWLTPYGIVSMSLEAVFALLFLLRPWRIPAEEALSSSKQKSLGYVLPMVGVFILLLFSTFAYRWDATMTQTFGMHVVSLDQVLETPVASLSETEEQYGVQLSLVATSMMNSIVDVRLKVIDLKSSNPLEKPGSLAGRSEASSWRTYAFAR
jgi:hypothetical protein